jgi:FlaA1/EpsC-like NDP-sugar epimerase
MSFAVSRIAMGLGYTLGFLLILTNRFIIIPWVITRVRREGKKNIVIVGSGKPAARVAQQALSQPKPGTAVGHIDRNNFIADSAGPNTIMIASREDADRVVLNNDIEQLYIAGDVLSATEVLNLLDRFRGRKLKVVVLDRTDDVLCQTKIPEKLTLR